MNPLSILYTPEPDRITTARERQFLARVRAVPTLRRLALLEAWTAGGVVAGDGEVAEFDARVERAERELMR